MSVTSAVRRHFVRALLFSSVLSIPVPGSWATIAIPTDFGSMVRKADLVFTGKVLGHRPEWANLNGRKAIVTFVSFEVLEVYKGSAGKELELRCPGGTIGDTTLELVGAPTFTKGERCVLFVRTNASVVCPVVGIYHGKLLLNRAADGPEETLSRHNGRALSNMSEIGKDDEGPLAAGPASKHAAAASARVTLSELRARIRQEIDSPNSALERK